MLKLEAILGHATEPAIADALHHLEHHGQVEYLTLLEHLDQTIPASVTTIHLLAYNVSVHHGKLVRRWLAAHPRFVAHFTPVHCSWMNPVEQWFGILRRKRLRSPNFPDLAALQAAIHQFIAAWNETAHPFRWTAKSYEKILAKVDAAIPASDVQQLGPVQMGESGAECIPRDIRKLPQQFERHVHADDRRGLQQVFLLHR